MAPEPVFINPGRKGRDCLHDFARAGVSGPAGAARIRLISKSPTIAAQKATWKPSMMDRTLASRRTNDARMVVARARAVSASALCWANRQATESLRYVVVSGRNVQADEMRMDLLAHA